MKRPPPQMMTINAQQIQSIVHKEVEKQVSIYVEKTTIEHRSGPLPDAKESEQYEVILPGFMNRWVTMSEKEQDGRFKVINRRDSFQFIYKIFSLLIAATVTLVLIGGGVFLLYHDKTMEGFATIGAAAAMIIGSILYQKVHPPTEEKNGK